MHEKLLKRLEKEWRNDIEIEMRLAILKLYAQYCDETKLPALRRFADYFDEDQLVDATIPQLERITTTLRYVRRRIAALGPRDTTDGQALSRGLSTDDKRRASRTLNTRLARGLTNHYVAPDGNYDLDNEFRGDMLDTD